MDQPKFSGVISACHCQNCRKSPHYGHADDDGEELKEVDVSDVKMLQILHQNVENNQNLNMERVNSGMLTKLGNPSWFRNNVTMKLNINF